MEAARRERDTLTRGNDETPLDLVHLHHIAFHLHLMDLRHAGDGRGRTDEAIVTGAGVGDGEIARAHRRVGQRGAAEGAGDFEIAGNDGGDVLGERGQRHCSEEREAEEKTVHLTLMS